MKFKSNKAKGTYYENESCDWWAKEMKIKTRPTPASGAIIGIPGDILFREGILKEFVVDVKAEKDLLTGRCVELYDKMKSDAMHKKCFLEIYVEGHDPMVVIGRNDLKRILYELQGYQNEG